MGCTHIDNKQMTKRKINPHNAIYMTLKGIDSVDSEISKYK